MNKLVLHQVIKCGANCLCGDKIQTIMNAKKDKHLMKTTLETYKNKQLQCYKYKNFRFIEYSLQRMKKEQK